jgi:glutamate racemase
VDSATDTAMEVYRILVEENLERGPGSPPVHHFAATGDTARFEALAQRFLGPVVTHVEDPSPATRDGAPL